MVELRDMPRCLLLPALCLGDLLWAATEYGHWRVGQIWTLSLLRLQWWHALGKNRTASLPAQQRRTGHRRHSSAVFSPKSPAVQNQLRHPPQAVTREIAQLRRERGRRAEGTVQVQYRLAQRGLNWPSCANRQGQHAQEPGTKSAELDTPSHIGRLPEYGTTPSLPPRLPSLVGAGHQIGNLA